MFERLPADSWSTVPSRVNDALSRAVRDAFDPARILNRGILGELGVTAELTTPACAIPGTPLAAATAGILACVHCGFCLQACPTYLALGDENDSPRGRIYLMRALTEGQLALDDPSLHTHIDQCLGCRACETACPSGVPYGALLEATRATIGAVKRPPLRARLLLALFARRGLMRIAVTGARLLRATGIPRFLSRLPGDVGFAFAMLASSETPLPRPAHEPHGDGSRGTFALLRGCVMEGLFAAANRSTVRTLVDNDYRAVPAPGQHCCGALHAHAGDLETARSLARRNIAAFERSGAEYVVTNAAGCGALLKEYDHLLGGDSAWAARAASFSARVRDVSELLAAAGPRGAHRCRFASPTMRHAICSTRSVFPRHRWSCSIRSPASSASRSSTPISAAAAPASTTCSSPRCPPPCSRPKSNISSSPAHP